MHRLLVIALTGLAALVLSGSAMAWSWPADGDVLRPFALSGDAYAAGQHRGVDVAGSEGSPVRAPAGGTVSFAGSLPTYGRGVTILTDDGYAVTLVHLGSIGVAKGDVVAEGASVGTMGSSGDAEHAVPSVHLGVRVAASAEGYVDPLGLLPPRAAPAPPRPSPSPAPVAATPPVVVPAAPPPAPPAQPATSATSTQPAAPSAAALPASEAPAMSVSAPQAAVDTPTASAPAASASAASTAVAPADAAATTSSGLTVTGVARVQGGGSTAFRVDSPKGVIRPATPTTRPPADVRPLAVDASTPTRATPRPADAGVADVGSPSAPASSRPDVGVEPRRHARAAAVADGDRPSERIARPAAVPRRIAPPRVASAAPAAAGPRDLASPQPAEPAHPAAVAAASVDGGARPGVLVAAALLLVLAAAAAARAARRIGVDGAVLRHHTDLLRQLHAPHRARVHDGGGGRVRTPSTAARP